MSKWGRDLQAALRSKHEENMRFYLELHKLDDGVVREHRFHKSRMWRFDFAWPAEKLAVEIEGVTPGGGRHQRIAGMVKDCEKYNTAVLEGWRVLRFTQKDVGDSAIEMIRQARGR